MPLDHANIIGSKTR